ncbi:MAG: T9SS type A sorting domain-containing protein [Flavobacteriales bacterium]|nr:T9SS type A sorting domain-containing protein [Flavobacteriales bacterium]
MYKLPILTTIILSSLLCNISFATIVTSNGTGGGAWSIDATWTPSVPACGDTITILAGDVITVETQLDYSACGSPMFITIDGTLDFNTNGQKLKLPCGSGIIVNVGGLVTSTGGGGGANNKIEICETEVWRTSDGDVAGYFVFGAALPVTLISFEAEIDNTAVKLTWKTSAEINNDFFTIERSQNGLDFEEIGEIPGNGNSNATKEYDLFDDSPLMGTSYYRLKQTDFDGKFEYIDLLAVNFNQDDDGICTLHVYPNPCVGSCTIDLKDCPLADSQVNIELYDAFGKKIINRITPKSRDQGISFHLNSANNLAPGVYIVRASANGKNQASKVIVK